MNLKELENRSVLLFGKNRAFSSDEFASQMKFHKISVCKEFNNDIAVVIDGKMMTPYEENTSDALYEKHSKTLEFISIDILEKELAKYIDPDTLLMSLKLSHDKARLKSFIQNSMLSDELFLKLLKMYSWSGEDFFENDDNRDVSAALILRFYKNIERNHNVQYAALGIMHLLLQTDKQELVELIAGLEPVQKSFNKNKNSANYKIVTTIATHYLAPESVLNLLIKKSDTYVRTLIAMRKDCNEEMQTALFNSGDETVLEAISYNKCIAKNIVDKLIINEKLSKNIAQNIKLDGELFKLFIYKHPVELAQNESLTFEMQESLVFLHDESVNISLATNIMIDKKVLSELLIEGSEDIKFAIYENSATPAETLEEAYENVHNHFSLSHNENTPSHILTLLAKSSDIKVLQGLAKNKSTPIEVLYQLQLDSRLARTVKENPEFGKYIQQENMGWEA